MNDSFDWAEWPSPCDRCGGLAFWWPALEAGYVLNRGIEFFPGAPRCIKCDPPRRFGSYLPERIARLRSNQKGNATHFLSRARTRGNPLS
jgi:hypothetical protein